MTATKRTVLLTTGSLLLAALVIVAVILVHQKHVADSRKVPGMKAAYGTPAGQTALTVCSQKMSDYASKNIWNEPGTISQTGVRVGTDGTDFYDVEFAAIVQMGCGVRVDPTTGVYEGRYALTVDGEVVEKS